MLAPECSESIGGLLFQLLARKLFVGWRQDKELEDATVDGGSRRTGRAPASAGFRLSAGVRSVIQISPSPARSVPTIDPGGPSRDDELAVRVVSGDDPAQFIDPDGSPPARISDLDFV